MDQDQRVRLGNLQPGQEHLCRFLLRVIIGKCAEVGKPREPRGRLTHAREALDTAVAADVRVRCNVHDRLVYGHPAQQILEVAAQEAPDLLVMGVQGRGALDLLMFGSTANYVLRHASCPVLTVRPGITGA